MFAKEKNKLITSNVYTVSFQLDIFLICKLGIVKLSYTEIVIFQRIALLSAWVYHDWIFLACTPDAGIVGRLPMDEKFLSSASLGKEKTLRTKQT